MLWVKTDETQYFIQQLVVVVVMLNKNAPGVKKARPIRKHQLACTRLKSVISGRGQGPSCLLGIV